jgi:hypothetical protein
LRRVRAGDSKLGKVGGRHVAMSSATTDLLARDAQGKRALGALKCSLGDPMFVFVAYHAASLLGLPRLADAYVRQAMVKRGGGMWVTSRSTCCGGRPERRAILAVSGKPL